MKKMEKLYGKGPLHEKKIWVPKTTVLTQAVHGSGHVEKKDTESECAFMDRGYQEEGTYDERPYAVCA